MSEKRPRSDSDSVNVELLRRYFDLQDRYDELVKRVGKDATPPPPPVEDPMQRRIADFGIRRPRVPTAETYYVAK
jgi:hypothetical protein